VNVQMIAAYSFTITDVVAPSSTTAIYTGSAWNRWNRWWTADSTNTTHDSGRETLQCSSDQSQKLNRTES